MWNRPSGAKGRRYGIPSGPCPPSDTILPPVRLQATTLPPIKNNPACCAQRRKSLKITAYFFSTHGKVGDPRGGIARGKGRQRPRRILAVRFVLPGNPTASTAVTVNTTQRMMRLWAVRFNEDGIKCLSCCGTGTRTRGFIHPGWQSCNRAVQREYRHRKNCAGGCAAGSAQDTAPATPGDPAGTASRARHPW